MKHSVRSAMIGLWFLLFAICVGLGFFLIELYQVSTDRQTKQAESAVERAGVAIQQRYAVYLANVDGGGGGIGDSESEVREMTLLLSLVLAQFDGIEGGFWTPSKNFVSYAFPTYGSEDSKKELPQSELKTINQVLKAAMTKNSSVIRRFNREHRTLIVYASPLAKISNAGAIWTMGWCGASDTGLFNKVIVVLSLLFFCSLLSGIWLAFFLSNWSTKVSELEQAISKSEIESLPPLPLTGQIELDRVVSALNLVNAQLKISQAATAKLSQDLARADKLTALGRMVAGFAHEIRNPLATICLSAENALEGAAGNQEKHLKVITRESQELENLVQKLLAVAKLNELKPQEIKLKTWLAKRIEFSVPKASAAGLTISGAAFDEVWSFDDESISRAINNLINNAIQNTPEGGYVVVSVTASSDKCTFAVEDSGAGVPENLRETIFEPLVSGRADGVGIGLTVVREVAQAHGGEVRCVQGAVGARFELEIPWLKS